MKGQICTSLNSTQHSMEFKHWCIYTTWLSWKVALAILVVTQNSVHPLKTQHQHASSPHCSSYISYGTAWENLFQYHNISSLVIILLILITCLFDHAVLLLGEIGCGSLSGLKELDCTNVHLNYLSNWWCKYFIYLLLLICRAINISYYPSSIINMFFLSVLTTTRDRELFLQWFVWVDCWETGFVHVNLQASKYLINILHSYIYQTFSIYSD